MELLGTYSVERIDTNNYNLEFKIPDNCSYSIDVKKSLTTITIQLNFGQTTPSANYNTYSTTVTAHNDEIKIDFKQQDWENNPSTYRIKPRMIISTIGV